MTLTLKRKLKNIIATTIAYSLIVIITVTILLICLKIANLIVTALSYEQVRQAVLIISFITMLIMLIMLILEFREE